MNEHALIKEKLVLAASGSLDPVEYRQVQEHTAECEMCRIELERWSLYAQSLQQLPHPPIPAGLVERTQARMQATNAALAQREASTSAWTLAVLASFGWVAGFAFWVLLEIFTGINAVEWFLVSTVLAWLTAGSAVVMFGHRGKIGRAL